MSERFAVHPLQAQAWLQAAYKGDREGLASSLGTGFWSSWFSNAGNTPLHLLVGHGKDPAMFDIALAEGAVPTPLSPDGTPMVHRLAHRYDTAVLPWIDKLMENSLDWEIRHAERTLFERFIGTGFVEAAQHMLHRGLSTWSTTTEPMLLALAPRHSSPVMLAWLRDQGCQPTEQTKADFYPRAIRTLLPIDKLSWCEDWGLPLGPCARALCAAAIVGEHAVGWVEELIRRGADPYEVDDLLEKSPYGLAHRGSAPQGPHWFDAAVSRAIAAKLDAVVGPALETASVRRARL